MNMSYPIEESQIISETTFASGERVIQIENGVQFDLIKDWMERELDIHLSTIVGQDEEDRIDLYYYFLNRSSHDKIVLRVELDRENPITKSVDSMINTVFYEGELTEMLGVKFTGQEFEQVFLPENWDKGYPLRKDWKDLKA